MVVVNFSGLVTFQWFGAPMPQRSSVSFITGNDASCGGYSGAGTDAGLAATTAVDEIMGAGQRSYGMGRDGESHNSLPRQRGDCKPPGGLQMSEAGRGGGSRREGDTRHESDANGREATSPSNE